jgi:Uncharacterized protein conserved in bacteria (DUF2188)
MSGRRFVSPRGNGWKVQIPGGGTTSNHRTQGAAIDAARKQLRGVGGGELTIQRPNGEIRGGDTVPPKSDPFPPRG